MKLLRLRLFGSPSIEYGGESSPLPFERRNQLLAFLALKGTWVARADLAAMLWPEQETRLAYTNLRKILFRLQSLPWCSGVDVQAGALRFEIETDVSAFESALREQRIADALQLRHGELLAGFEDDANEAWSAWLGFERDRLRVAWRSAALERLSAGIEAAEGIALSARLLDADPLDEAALRAHMSWLAQDGQGARARQAYREFVGRLQRDLGLAPGAELKALHDSLGAQVAPSPAAVSAASPPSDGFVGRSAELQRIANRIAQDDCRLLCLVGPGGVGKTRLAGRALQDLAPGFADGAAFIALEDLSTGNELGGRLAREIGLDPGGGRQPLDQVIEFLRERHMLLVLDNFEQLAADASILEKLLQACPRLKLVVTSRVRLGIGSEWQMPIEGLPAPEIDDQDRIEAFDAVRLFVKAAHRVEPALIAATEAAAIVEICALVEGLPLALELAAAWTRVLSCEAIAGELRQGTELLRAVGAGQPPRHASIDVVFDQSWRLLGAIERDALSRLSAFRGGFTAEAARAVAGASLPVLGALADKSLLRKNEDGRIHLHPLVQQLARLRLDEGEVRASAYEAHALHFHRLLTQLRRATETGDRQALDWLDTEFENCRIAWRWAIENGTAEALWKSAPTLQQFCDYRGRLEAGLAMFRDALESRAARADPRLGALLLGSVSHLEYRLDRYAEAQADASRALALARSAGGDEDTQLQCVKVLGSCSLRLGRHADARRYFKQALEMAPADTHPRSAAAMIDHLALVEKATGHYDEALRLSLEALVQYRRLGDAGGEALCLNNLGVLYLDRGEHAPAGAHFRDALAICDRHGIVNTRVLLLANLAELAIEVDDRDSAQAYGVRALELAEATGNRAVAAWLRLQFVRLALRRSDLAAARSELATAMAVAVTIGRPSLMLAGVARFAEVLAAQQEPDCARLVMSYAAEHPATQPLERDMIRARLATSETAAGAQRPWPGLTLDELVHRIVVEAGIAHAPLIASLRAG